MAKILGHKVALTVSLMALLEGTLDKFQTPCLTKAFFHFRSSYVPPLVSFCAFISYALLPYAEIELSERISVFDFKVEE